MSDVETIRRVIERGMCHRDRLAQQGCDVCEAKLEALEALDRLAGAEQRRQIATSDAAALRGAYRNVLAGRDEARAELDKARAQIALAMAWGAEVCATVERLTADSGVSHGEVAEWLVHGKPLPRPCPECGIGDAGNCCAAERAAKRKGP